MESKSKSSSKSQFRCSSNWRRSSFNVAILKVKARKFLGRQFECQKMQIEFFSYYGSMGLNGAWFFSVTGQMASLSVLGKYRVVYINQASILYLVTGKTENSPRWNDSIMTWVSLLSKGMIVSVITDLSLSKMQSLHGLESGLLPGQLIWLTSIISFLLSCHMFDSVKIVLTFSLLIGLFLISTILKLPALPLEPVTSQIQITMVSLCLERHHMIIESLFPLQITSQQLNYPSFMTDWSIISSVMAEQQAILRRWSKELPLSIIARRWVFVKKYIVSAAVVSPMKPCDKDLIVRDRRSMTWILDQLFSQNTTVQSLGISITLIGQMEIYLQNYLPSLSIWRMTSSMPALKTPSTTKVLLKAGAMRRIL